MANHIGRRAGHPLCVGQRFGFKHCSQEHGRGTILEKSHGTGPQLQISKYLKAEDKASGRTGFRPLVKSFGIVLEQSPNHHITEWIRGRRSQHHRVKSKIASNGPEVNGRNLESPR